MSALTLADVPRKATRLSDLSMHHPGCICTARAPPLSRITSHARGKRRRCRQRTQVQRPFQFQEIKHT